jgi:hypothetical protein
VLVYYFALEATIGQTVGKLGSKGFLASRSAILRETYTLCDG